MKKSFPILIGLATLLIIAGGVIVLSKNSSPSPTPYPLSPNTYEYFWGDGCPHCANVEEFLKSWNPPSNEEGKKVEIEKKEVWKNRGNANLMLARAKSCDISPSEVGVPFLVTPEGHCLTGDTPIIEFLKKL